MTEPQGGADPKEFRCRARRDGDQWVIDGEKYFSSHADLAEFLIVMAITNPDVPVHQGASMFLVPRDTPGLDVPPHGRARAASRSAHGHHPHLRYDDVPRARREPARRRGPGVRDRADAARRRPHPSRDADGRDGATRARACSASARSRRHTQGEMLAQKQMVQQYVADSFIQLEQFRLLVLYTAWLIDKGRKKDARTYIAAVKVAMADVLHDVVRRALHVHGALGCSNEMPLIGMWMARAGDGNRRRPDRRSTR